MKQPANKSNKAQPPRAPLSEVLLTAYIDLYKHHYELWLRGFFVYLGVLGVVAGFLFSNDLLPGERNLLLVFIFAASLVAIVAFFVGFRWLSDFEKVFQDLPEAPPLAIVSFKCLIIMAMVVAILFSVFAIKIYEPPLRLDDIQHLQKDSLSAGARHCPGSARTGETTREPFLIGSYNLPIHVSHLESPQDWGLLHDTREKSISLLGLRIQPGLVHQSIPSALERAHKVIPYEISDRSTAYTGIQI